MSWRRTTPPPPVARATTTSGGGPLGRVGSRSPGTGAAVLSMASAPYKHHCMSHLRYVSSSAAVVVGILPPEDGGVLLVLDQHQPGPGQLAGLGRLGRTQPDPPPLQGSFGDPQPRPEPAPGSLPPGVLPTVMSPRQHLLAFAAQVVGHVPPRHPHRIGAPAEVVVERLFIVLADQHGHE